MGEWVSEWLEFSANSAILQLYHGKNKLIFSEVNWIFIVLSHWNNSSRVDMSFHSGTLFWIRANQSFFFLLNDAWLAEMQHIPIL
jgi:hypothetical protein